MEMPCGACGNEDVDNDSGYEMDQRYGREPCVNEVDEEGGNGHSHHRFTVVS